MTLQELRDGIDAMTKAIDGVIEALPYGGELLKRESRTYLRMLRDERASYERALTFRIDCGEMDEVQR